MVLKVGFNQKKIIFTSLETENSFQRDDYVTAILKWKESITTFQIGLDFSCEWRSQRYEQNNQINESINFFRAYKSW